MSEGISVMTRLNPFSVVVGILLGVFIIPKLKKAIK